METKLGDWEEFKRQGMTLVASFNCPHCGLWSAAADDAEGKAVLLHAAPFCAQFQELATFDELENFVLRGLAAESGGLS